MLRKEKGITQKELAEQLFISDKAVSKWETGLSFNNSNWEKILKVGRIWAVTLMLVYPIISYMETLLFTGIWRDIVDLFFALFLTLGGLFIPIYMVGKKCE